MIITGTKAPQNVNASDPTYDPELMFLSIKDVEIANGIADGDDELFVVTLTQMGYDNFVSGSSSEVDEGYTIFGVNLTNDEVELLIDYPHLAPLWFLASQIALSKTAELYENQTDGTIANSFQHSYWNVLMVKYIGYNRAQDFATAHEAFDGNPWIHKSMDLFNNESGRNFANGISGLFWKSDNTLATMTNTLVTDGLLKYILFDYEYISAYVYYDNFVIEVEYSNMDLHAYTDNSYPIHMPEFEIIDNRTNPGPIIRPMDLMFIAEEVIIYVEEGEIE